MTIFSDWASFWAVPWVHTFAPILPFLLLWEGFWKGLALWHSTRRGQPWWFLILLVVSTVGILAIIYLFAAAKLKWSELCSKKV